MAIAPGTTHNEGLKTARLLMVLSSILPLFILWAIRGNRLIPDHYLSNHPPAKLEAFIMWAAQSG